ncbi:uncharacterized protein LOC119646981 isoform X2 [Hermetia illucens]|uniref:uncharacterized protein LOC119646981 isoform X2 n=1 Tax=Hermetia illucens TaxID=343691 RepID=UPI0018CC7952|nr:uncharacterized protein LOC119646981 isoform X2 [Hermetia illucens]
MSMKRPQFVTDPSDSSLIHDPVLRKRTETPRRSVRQEKLVTTLTPRFVDKSPLIPDKTTKVAIFNSSGEKTEASNTFSILTGGCVNTDTESVHMAPSVNQLSRGTGYNVNSWMALNRIGTMEASDIKARDHGDGVDAETKLKKPSGKYPIKRSRTRLAIVRKKHSRTDLRPKIPDEHKSKNKETSTESIIQSHATTQTDHRFAYCRKCSQYSSNPIPSATNLDKKNLKPVQYPGVEQRVNTSKSPNAFCTAVNVALPTPKTLNTGEPSNEALKIASSADLVKSKRNSNAKRHTSEKTEAIHQEIMNLKKAVEQSHTKKTSILNGTLPIKTGDIYREIKRANRNGSLRYILSMLVFGVLLFWLVSSMFHFDLLLDIFRTIGRYLASLPIFITRRKKELSKIEVAVKYAGSFARILRTILVGTPNPGRY